MTKPIKDPNAHEIWAAITCIPDSLDYHKIGCIINPDLSLDQQIRIALFDDSIDAIYRAEQEWKKDYVVLMAIKSPIIDNHYQELLRRFCPNLIVTDLVKGTSPEDGYNLIKQLQDFPEIKKIPICVVSKCITTSEIGEQQKIRALATHGVVGAYGKYPRLPSLEVLMGHARPYVSGGE